jgi:hypothetical protein
MKTTDVPMRLIDKRIRNAASMIVFALAVTLISLLIFHPLSFIAYIIFGVAIMAVANVYYLFALLSPSSRKPVAAVVAPTVLVGVEREAA